MMHSNPMLRMHINSHFQMPSSLAVGVQSPGCTAISISMAMIMLESNAIKLVSKIVLGNVLSIMN